MTNVRKGLYISGILGLGALLGAGCIGGVLVDPVEEPAAVHRYRNFGDIVDVVHDDGTLERIEYLREQLEETTFDLWGLHRTSAADAWELTKDYGRGTHVSPSVSEDTNPLSFIDILMDMYGVDTPGEAMRLRSEEFGIDGLNPFYEIMREYKESDKPSSGGSNTIPE